MKHVQLARGLIRELARTAAILMMLVFTYDTTQGAEDGPTKNYASTRYSGLAQITAANATMILADLKIGGRLHKTLVSFNKNGFQYTLDRATGEVLSAPPFVTVTWATSIDLTTGRPVLDSGKQTGASKGNIKGICPSLEGGVSPASPGAYSPRTGLFYTSTNNFCMDFAATRATYIRGVPFIGVNSPYHPGPGGHLGSFMAWDATSGKKVWEIKEPYPSWSGALVTAGDVAFYGTLDGWFKSVDARTGELLSKFKVGSGVVGNPITYTGPDGKQ